MGWPGDFGHPGQRLRSWAVVLCRPRAPTTARVTLLRARKLVSRPRLCATIVATLRRVVLSDEPPASTPAPLSGNSARVPRDFRLDFFRGLALFFIFVDHIPDNPVAHFTLRAFSLADAAEVFIFISGYTAAMVYGQRMLRHGPLFASAQILRRTWQLYVAHLCLFLLYSAQVAYTVQHFDNPLFSDELGIGEFLTRPVDTLFRVLLLEFQPAYLDILPLYISLLLVFPLVILAIRRHALLALVPSFGMYLLAQFTSINMPGNTDSDGWYFNPFAWQFLFVIAAVLGYRRTVGRDNLPVRGRAWIIGAAVVIAAAGMVIQVSWTLHQLDGRIPGILFQTLWPIDKTTLPPLRIVSILAIAVLAGHFVSRAAGFMISRVGWVIVLCGQNSLNVFCLSILLSLMGNIALTFVSRTWEMLAVVNVGGVVVMVGLGLLSAWYGNGGRLPARPGGADLVPTARAPF
jgi:hypothetical protein